jgi:hypothetical protein
MVSVRSVQVGRSRSAGAAICLAPWQEEVVLSGAAELERVRGAFRIRRS